MASAKNLELNIIASALYLTIKNIIVLALIINIIASALYLLLYLIVSAHGGVLLNLDKVSVYYLDPLNFRCF